MPQLRWTSRIFANHKLGDVYNRWGKFELAEACYRKMLVLEEKQFGPSSPNLIDPLEGLARALDHLGKATESAELRSRKQAILMASAQGRK